MGKAGCGAFSSSITSAYGSFWGAAILSMRATCDGFSGVGAIKPEGPSEFSKRWALMASYSLFLSNSSILWNCSLIFALHRYTFSSFSAQRLRIQSFSSSKYLICFFCRSNSSIYGDDRRLRRRGLGVSFGRDIFTLACGWHKSKLSSELMSFLSTINISSAIIFIVLVIAQLLLKIKFQIKWRRGFGVVDFGQNRW